MLLAADVVGLLPEPAIRRRLAGLLPLLRPVADEVVVAVDDRADLRVLAAAASLVDRLFIVPYADPPERSFQWLHEQTTGDWVFRIDDDEAPSHALLELLGRPARRCRQRVRSPVLALAGRLARLLPVAAGLAAAARPARRGRFPGADARAGTRRGNRALRGGARSTTSTCSARTVTLARRRPAATSRSGRGCASPGSQ